MARQHEMLGDERIVDRGDDTAVRGSARRPDEARDEDGTVMTRAERMNMIRDTWQQVALPTPPVMPGYHMCWLSTTNASDTIQRRMKLGYRLVRKDELPDFEVEKMNSANYAEYITCNEMVLAKLPVDIYEDVMRTFHEDMPLEEESSIRERMDNTKESLNRQAGKEVIASEGEGWDALGQKRRKAKFIP